MATQGIPQRSDTPVSIPVTTRATETVSNRSERASRSLAYDRPSARASVSDRAVPRTPAECASALQDLVRRYREFQLSREDYIGCTIRWARDAKTIGVTPNVALDMARTATTGRRDTRWSYVFLQPDLARVTLDCIRYGFEVPEPNGRRRTTGNNATIRATTPVAPFAGLILPPELDDPVDRSSWR